METLYVYFAEAARQGSIRKAAERLNISASSVSRHIGRLEHTLGAPLIERRTHGVKLTPAGDLLLRFIEDHSRELARLRSAIDELKHLERGHVSIYTVEGMLGSVLPQALTRFSRSHPNLTYEVIVAGTDNVVRAVADDRCDIGIAFEPQPVQGIAMVGRMSQPVLAVMTARHPLATRRSLALADLVGVPLGLPDKSFGIRQIFDRALGQAGGLTVRMETNSIDMTRQFALAGMGVTFLPFFAFEREAKAGELVGVEIDDAGFASAMAQLCIHAERDLTFAARQMLTALQDSFAR
ncbi:LysR family transcriptional regulator [Acuticoccus sediminis]|uniref:LysR family transcriptional regulator n=1 Tax=Acuticoccus sediminis TaxID=2184697 RepID=UPI001CFD6F46|nr:LysR family transcriptional regulator [Acuticoccus sediminis]